MGLKKSQIFRFIDHLQTSNILASSMHIDDGIDDHVHVRLCITWRGRVRRRSSRAGRLFFPVSGSRPADTLPRSIERIPAPM